MYSVQIPLSYSVSTHVSFDEHRPPHTERLRAENPINRLASFVEYIGILSHPIVSMVLSIFEAHVVVLDEYIQ
jgi:hypothetical protein